MQVPYHSISSVHSSMESHLDHGHAIHRLEESSRQEWLPAKHVAHHEIDALGPCTFLLCAPSDPLEPLDNIHMFSQGNSS
eukprot:Gb_19100 [translate_table: standard]